MLPTPFLLLNNNVFLIVDFWADLGIAQALVDVLVARPAEVLAANVAVIGLGSISVHGVGRVALGTANALALGECEQLGFLITVQIVGVCVGANDAEFAEAHETVRHPLDLVHILVVVLSKAALGRLVHVFDSLDVFGVLVVRQVQQRQDNIAWHDILAPFGCLAHHKVYGDLLMVFQHLLYRKSDLRLNAVDAGGVAAQVCQDDARLLLRVAHGAQGIRYGDQLRGHGILIILLHRFVQVGVV